MSACTYQDKRQVFTKHPLLQKLSETEVDNLLKFSRVEYYPAGEPIFDKDSAGTCLMVVLHGSVKVSSMSLAGREIVFNIITTGEIVGEIAVLDEGPRTCDAAAMTDCELLVLNRRDFMPLLERHADICLLLIKILCTRLRHTSEQVEDLLFRQAESRIAKALLYLFRRLGGQNIAHRDFELHLAQSELGSMVGITRESVNQKLSVWQRAGYVKLANRSIVILDPAALERLI